jgi:Helix-turn-helix domain
MSPTEAAERWGLKRNTIIAALNRGRFDEQIERGLVKKYETEYGKNEWYITVQAMKEVYGPEPENKEDYKEE